MSLCGVALIYVITCRGRVGVVRLFESGPVFCDRPAFMQSRKHRNIALDQASLNMVLKHLIDRYCPRYHFQKEREHPKYTCTKMNELMRSCPKKKLVALIRIVYTPLTVPVPVPYRTATPVRSSEVDRGT